MVWGIVTYKFPLGLPTLDLSVSMWWRYASVSPALHTVLVLPIVVALGRAIGTAAGKRIGGSVVPDDAPEGNPHATPLG